VEFLKDARRAIIRVAGKPITTTDLSFNEVTLNDTWVWLNRNWYYDPAEKFNPYADRLTSRDSEAHLAEIERHFKLTSGVIKVGTIWNSDQPVFPVSFEYTGDVSIRITSPEMNALVMVDKDTTEYIRPGTTSFNIRVFPALFEGLFRYPLPLTVHYREVALKKTLIIEGTVFSPLSFRHVPETVSRDTDQVEVFVRNNTDAVVRVVDVQSNGDLDVEGLGEIPKQGERRLLLKPVEGLADYPYGITVLTAQPIRGKTQFHFKFRKSPS